MKTSRKASSEPQAAPPRDKPPQADRLLRGLLVALCCAGLWLAAWGTLAAWSVLLMPKVAPGTQGRIDYMDMRLKLLEAEAKARRMP